jgi:hypothetical protein
MKNGKYTNISWKRIAKNRRPWCLKNTLQLLGNIKSLGLICSGVCLSMFWIIDYSYNYLKIPRRNF